MARIFRDDSDSSGVISAARIMREAHTPYGPVTNVNLDKLSNGHGIGGVSTNLCHAAGALSRNSSYLFELQFHREKLNECR